MRGWGQGAALMAAPQGGPGVGGPCRTGVRWCGHSWGTSGLPSLFLEIDLVSSMRRRAKEEVHTGAPGLPMAPRDATPETKNVSTTPHP